MLHKISQWRGISQKIHGKFAKIQWLNLKIIYFRQLHIMTTRHCERTKWAWQSIMHEVHFCVNLCLKTHLWCVIDCHDFATQNLAMTGNFTKNSRKFAKIQLFNLDFFSKSVETIVILSLLQKGEESINGKISKIRGYFATLSMTSRVFPKFNTFLEKSL